MRSCRERVVSLIYAMESLDGKDERRVLSFSVLGREDNRLLCLRRIHCRLVVVVARLSFAHVEGIPSRHYRVSSWIESMIVQWE